MADLAPCPFCEKPAEFIVRHVEEDCRREVVDYFDVGCNTRRCYLEYGADWHLESKAEAARMWNTRGGAVLVQPERKPVMDPDGDGTESFFDEIDMQDMVNYWAETYSEGVKAGRWYYDCKRGVLLLRLTFNAPGGDED